MKYQSPQLDIIFSKYKLCLKNYNPFLTLNSKKKHDFQFIVVKLLNQV